MTDHDDGGQDSLKTKRPTPTSTIRAATALESVAHRHLTAIADAGHSVKDPTTGIEHVISILDRDTWEFQPHPEHDPKGQPGLWSRQHLIHIDEMPQWHLPRSCNPTGTGAATCVKTGHIAASLESAFGSECTDAAFVAT